LGAAPVARARLKRWAAAVSGCQKLRSVATLHRRFAGARCRRGAGGSAGACTVRARAASPMDVTAPLLRGSSHLSSEHSAQVRAAAACDAMRRLRGGVADTRRHSVCDASCLVGNGVAGARRRSGSAQLRWAMSQLDDAECSVQRIVQSAQPTSVEGVAVSPICALPKV